MSPSFLDAYSLVFYLINTYAESQFRAVMSVLTASIAIPIHFNLIPDGVFLFAIYIFPSNPAVQAESGTDRPPRCSWHTDGFPHWGPC